MTVADLQGELAPEATMKVVVLFDDFAVVANAIGHLDLLLPPSDDDFRRQMRIVSLQPISCGGRVSAARGLRCGVGRHGCKSVQTASSRLAHRLET